MALLPSLLRLARLHPSAWLRKQPQGSAQAVLRACSLSAAAPAAAAPLLPRAACSCRALATSSSSTSSSRTSSRRGGGSRSSRRAAAPRPQQEQQQQAGRRRGVVASAGKRGNVFLDADSVEAGKKKKGGDDDDGYDPAKLFDSSRFNYDSEEEDEEDAAAATPDEQAAAAVSQQRRRRRRSGQAAAAEGGSGEAAAAAADAEAAAAAAGKEDSEDEEEEGEGSVEVVLPPPRGVRVKQAEFVKSSVSVDQCPPARFPEFAVIGRSNVGKSSLINLLTGRKDLAMVSKTPGKTRCINHFIVNGAWYLVDLPGYGYAKISKSSAVEWNKFTRQYFLERETLVTVLLLVDASIPPQPLDVSCAQWFAEAEIPFTLVFTKLDKRKKGGTPAEENIAAFEAAVAAAAGYAPPSILTSARSGRGRSELLAHVAQLRDFFNKQNKGM